jgi:hypothetical protein
MNDIYVKNGYKNRKDYLKSLAKEYGIDYSTVCTLAYALGKNEDFDGLISTLDDYVDTMDYDEF